ncbi:MAG: tetratricopeptide repeat protein [Bacteroidales bacterium]|nr:tetratricopeptide repeat protein [Bacteroidales bacterium]
MKIKIAILGRSVAIAMGAAGLVGCGGSHNSQPSRDDWTAIVETADSLIDIKPDSTLVLCRRFFEECPAPAESLRARAKLIEGNAYFSLGDLDEARASMAQARDWAMACGDQYALINATSDLGVAMRVSQQPDSALSLYNEALEMIPQGEYLDERAHLLTSIAILYANTGRLDEAREYADRAVEAANLCGDMDMIMYASSQAGAIYNLLGDNAKGLQLTHLAADLARRNNLPRYELKALGHMIDLHLRDGRRDSALFYLARGEEIAGQFPRNSVEGLGFLEEKYVVLAALGRHRESIAVQRLLLGFGDDAAAFMPRDKLWLRMARNYQALGRGDSAAICYERAIEVADSLRGEETDNQLSEFYARFRTSEKELALANLERQKARTDMWLSIWIGVAVFCLMLVAVALMYMRNRRRGERLRLIQSRLEGVEQERGRLARELHDGVCNDLYGIELLMQSSMPTDQLLTDVERIRSDVRRISHQLMPPSLRDLELPQAFEELVGKLRHAYGGCQFHLSVDSTRDWHAVPQGITYGLYRVAQEIIGNALRHAEPTELSLDITLDAHDIILVFSHNGHTQGGSGRGIGIQSVKERLASLNATAQGLPFADKVTIRCPYHGKP